MIEFAAHRILCEERLKYREVQDAIPKPRFKPIE